MAGKGRIPLSGYGQTQLARIRRGFNKLKGTSRTFGLGTGTNGYTLNNDADVSGAVDLAAVKVQLLKLVQVVRADLEERISKGQVDQT